MAVNTEPPVVFFCFDQTYPGIDAVVEESLRGLKAQGLDVRVKDEKFGAEFLRSGAEKEGLLCFVPADFASLERLAEDASTRISHEKTKYLGVIGPYGPLGAYRSEPFRRVFSKLIAVGFHVSQAELIEGQLVWDANRIGDLCFHPEEHTIRYTSNQVGDKVPDDVLDSYFGVFKSAIAQVFHCGLFDGPSDGALAMRIPGVGVLMNATKSLKIPSQFKAENLSLVRDWDRETNTVTWQGKRLPTSGTVWYWSLFSQRSDVDAMVHVHDRHITHSAAPEVLAVRSATFAKYGGEAGLEDILEILQTSPIALLRAHGPVSIGSGFDDALDHVIALRDRATGAYFGPP